MILLDLDLPVDKFQQEKKDEEDLLVATPLGISEGVGVILSDLLSSQECKYATITLHHSTSLALYQTSR